MEDLFGIQSHRQGVAENIQKALGAGYKPEGTDENTNIQKGRVGVYEDNAENRRLNRVGQQYGKKKEEEQPKGKTFSNKEEDRKRTNRIAELNSKLNSESGLTDEEYSEYKKLTQKQSDVSSHAAKASDGALKRAAADEKAPEDVRNAAKEELKKRGGKKDEKNEDKNLSGEKLANSISSDKEKLDEMDKGSDEYKKLKRELKKKSEKLSNEIYEEMGEIASETHNDSEEFRSGAWNLYEKLKNGISANKFVYSIGHMDGGQMIHMVQYFNLRKTGHDNKTAEKYIQAFNKYYREAIDYEDEKGVRRTRSVESSMWIANDKAKDAIGESLNRFTNYYNDAKVF